MSAETTSGAAAELFSLQIAQMKHDEFYHREIARLTVHARLNHMALHFCKYVGQLAECGPSGNEAGVMRAITDTFIIDLSSANILGIKLVSTIPDVSNENSLADCGRRLLRSRNLGNAAEWLLFTYAIEAAKMARACEKLDHLEAYPFREAISSALSNICATSMAAAEVFGFDLVKSVRDRLHEVERRYLFDTAQ
jgi:hypothetical protein